MDQSPDVQLGDVTASAFPEFRRAFGRTFGFEPSDDDIGRTREVAKDARLLAARDVRDEIVGTSGTFPFRISLPGGAEAPCGGVSMVSVRADHRRRGLLTRMMSHLLDDATHCGEPFAALWSSESPIYPRYGFGAAVPTVGISLDRRHARLRRRGPVDRVRLVALDAARERFPAIHARSRRRRAGLMDRSPAWWDRVLTDRPHAPEGAGPLRYAVLEDRGYVVYRLRSRWSAGAPHGTVEVVDLVALDADATAALWGFVIDTDLAERVEAVRRPVDEPLLQLLEDPARATVTQGAPLYVRIVDVPAAVTARSYALDGTFVTEVDDGFLAHNSGRWRIGIVDGRASCVRTDEPADVQVTAESLAVLLLGGLSPGALAQAGRLEAAPDQLVLLAQRLCTPLAPTCDQMF